MYKCISCFLVSVQLLTPLSVFSQQQEHGRKIPVPQIEFIPDTLAIPGRKKQQAEDVINKLDGLYKETESIKKGNRDDNKNELIDAELKRLEDLLALMLFMMSEHRDAKDKKSIGENIVSKSAPSAEFTKQFPDQSNNNLQVALAAVGVVLVAFQPELAPFILPVITAILLAESTSEEKINAVRAIAESVASGKISVDSRNFLENAGVERGILDQFVDRQGNFKVAERDWVTSGDTTFKHILQTLLKPKGDDGDENRLFEALLSQNPEYIKNARFLTETELYKKASKLPLDENRRKILQQAAEQAAEQDAKADQE